ncbi:MAG: helix-turn-helix transcriptional regulator [Deltaproteobacteria bacterium]|nr:helix-turn-helix transcriptional regulator [Deltaproteobacteria bacterium]
MSELEGRRERKKRARRERIYEAARQLFLERGYGATTVEQISEAADVAQATFFNHFPSKAAVLREMTGEVSARLEAMLERELETPGTAEQRIRRFATTALVALAAAEGLAREVLLDLLRTASGPGTALPYLASVREPFTTIVREGQSAGDVRSDLDAALLAELVVGILNTALLGWLNDPEYPFEERLGKYADLIAELLRPRPAGAQARPCHGRLLAGGGGGLPTP